MPTVQVVDAKGKDIGTLELSPEVFGVEVKAPLLHQAVVREQAARHVGTHDTKGRSEVSGGGKKPWKQKGTGRARQGSIRATQWKGGGKPFGPTPRGYAKALPRAMRREALRGALTAALAGDRVRVVDALAADGKSKALVAGLQQLGLQAAPTLIVTAAVGEALLRAARNVPWLTVESPGQVSVYQLVRARQVVFERAALKTLEEALSA